MWAISSETVNSLVGLSLNFFFVLPAMNSGTLVLLFPSLYNYVLLLLTCQSIQKACLMFCRFNRLIIWNCLSPDNLFLF